jgi:sugar-specific transcriptional regulator TrmB
MEIDQLLKQFGLSDKEIKVYLALLESGSASVRKLADKTNVNRGTVYDVLKDLKELGLAAYYHKSTKQFFTAEDPSRLVDVLDNKVQNLENIRTEISAVIPQLKSLQAKAGDKPVVKYYEGSSGIKTILNDVLENAGKAYCVFSSSTIRPFIYKALPTFTKQRIKKQISVQSIAIGHSGSKDGLAEVRSLSAKEGSPTYILIYNGKVAMISVNSKNQPLGLIIEDAAIHQTQKQLFDFIWQSLILNP